MTDDRLPLAELMAKTGDGDFLRTIAESVLQIIMEADVDGLVGAVHTQRLVGERDQHHHDQHPQRVRRRHAVDAA